MSPLDPEAMKRAGDRCKKCQAEILWATTVPSKAGREPKAIPIDAELVYGGNVTLEVDNVGMLKARVVRPAGDVAAYVAHFTTCPAAEYFRNGGAAAPDPGADHDEQRTAKLRALQVRMPFGQYAGQTLEEVDRSTKGHGYLQWALRNLEWRRTDVKAAIATVLGVES